MKSVLILCRHGNTFAKGEKVFMVGAREDLPLTEEGLRQAANVGAALRGIASHVERIISGPLQRTRVYADVLKQSSGTGTPIAIDNRLTELDYGEWSGLSNEEIAALSGEEALRAWQERGIRPTQVQFYPSETSVAEEVSDLLRESESRSGVTIIVTSNGRLREFRRLVQAKDEPRENGKVRTGGSCVLVPGGSGWRIVAWNCDPKELGVALAELE